MKFCTTCGAQLDDDATECPNCAVSKSPVPQQKLSDVANEQAEVQAADGFDEKATAVDAEPAEATEQPQTEQTLVEEEAEPVVEAQPIPEQTQPQAATTCFCNVCGNPLAVGATFCTKCGTQKGTVPVPQAQPVKRFCVHCGSVLNDGAVFCSKCGANVNSAPKPSVVYVLTPAVRQVPAPSTEQPKSLDPLTIVGFVLSLIPFLSFIGFIISIVALVQVTKSKQIGYGFALAGVIIGAFYIFADVVIGILAALDMLSAIVGSGL